jgi:hypothetical protein
MNGIEMAELFASFGTLGLLGGITGVSIFMRRRRKKAQALPGKRDAQSDNAAKIQALQGIMGAQANAMNAFTQAMGIQSGKLASHTPNVQNVKTRKMDDPQEGYVSIRSRLHDLPNMDMQQGLMLVHQILYELDERTDGEPDNKACVGCEELETRLEELEKDFDELRGQQK